MVALIQFLFLVVHYLIQAVIWFIIAYVIMTWLVSFDVINMRNRFANQAVRFLERVNRPLLRPVSRIIPTIGGLDLSPMIIIIVLTAADQVLLPALGNWLISLVV
jgi:YggT family protein